MKRLHQVPLYHPCVLGLDEYKANEVSSHNYATKLSNVVFDSFGRIAARKGWSKVNGSTITDPIEAIGEYVSSTGTHNLVHAANGSLYEGTTTLNDITGTLTPSDDNWKFVSFNTSVLGFQDGETPIVYSGSGNFADITFSYPTTGTNTYSGIALTAFGRVWSTDQYKRVLKYSALLDETSWTDDSGGNGDTAADAGIIDMHTVWPAGVDEISALAEFNNYLIIFGNDSIVIYAGADDPVNMYKADAISGVGCVARDSVQNIGDDLLFLSRYGVSSFGRQVVQKNLPTNNLTTNIRTTLNTYLDLEDTDLIRSAYHEKEGFYILIFPTYETALLVDTKKVEGARYRLAYWENITMKTAYASKTGNLYLGQTGYLGLYDTYADDGSEYTIDIETGWFDLRNIDPQIGLSYKLTKYIYANIYTTASNTVTLKWFFDFKDTQNTYSYFFTGADVAEYNEAEYNIAEWGGGASIFLTRAPGEGSGTVIKLGMTASVAATIIALQSFIMYFKVGRR